MKYCIKKTIICTLLALTFVFSISAASWSEMRENGEVSDGGITYGDPRDGIVSDVSDDSEGLIPEISSAIDDGLGIGSSDMTNDMTDDPLMGGMGESSAPETSRATSEATSDTTANTGGNDEDGGMSAGLIIAILVVVAVIVIIFILLPKRR